MDTDPPPVDMSLPAGLENIRNTCYLNSILQYLFTVRGMREIVLDWDRYGLENTEENLLARRIDPGSSRVQRGEAFSGQQCESIDRNLKPPADA
jgi:ubiquitin carboxyl-terminal hydrolase 25